MLKWYDLLKHYIEKNLTLHLSKFYAKLLILGLFLGIAIVARVLTGKLLTGKITTGIFSTDKVFVSYSNNCQNLLTLIQTK